MGGWTAATAIRDHSRVRVLGAQPGPLQRALPWLVAVGVFLLLASATVWVRQQEAARRVAEARAETAEAELAVARASLTALTQAQALASATAVAQASDPTQALRRALDLLFAAYQEPTEARLSALNAVFSPAARAIVQPEAEYLISGGRRLAGQSRYSLTVLGTTPGGPDRVDVRTREEWVYDERDQADRPARCVREEGEQTYTLRRTADGWFVEAIELGTARRSDC